MREYELPDPFDLRLPMMSLVKGSMKEATRHTRLAHGDRFEYFDWLQKMEDELAKYASYELQAEEAWRHVEDLRRGLLSFVPGSPAGESYLETIKEQQARYSSMKRYADSHRGKFLELVRQIQLNP